VADADADSRALYRACLRPIGCDVVDAADGRDALVSALAHRPSLVITETVLPVFDGYALLALLRQDVMTRGVPVLVVTTESREPELTRARDAGADGVLIKPVTPEELLREVQRLLRQTPEMDRSPETAPNRQRPRTHASVVTTTPPTPPPSLRCPTCDGPLNYEQSHVGGVRNSAEQWDTFICSRCGLFEYRQRTRKLRKLK